MNKVSHAPASPLTRRRPGTIDALSVIETDEKYKSLAQQLLGNVLIADDESALQNSNGFVILENTVNT